MRSEAKEGEKREKERNRVKAERKERRAATTSLTAKASLSSFKPKKKKGACVVFLVNWKLFLAFPLHDARVPSCLGDEMKRKERDGLARER